MHRWRAGSTPSKPSWFTTPHMRPARRPSVTCLPISKDTTTVSGSTPPSDTSPPNRQSFRPRNPVSTFSGEHHGSGPLYFDPYIVSGGPAWVGENPALPRNPQNRSLSRTNEPPCHDPHRQPFRKHHGVQPSRG